MCYFVKDHSMRKSTVIALVCSVLAYKIISLVLVSEHLFSLYLTFVKLRDSFEKTVFKTSTFLYRLHTHDRKNESNIFVRATSPRQVLHRAVIQEEFVKKLTKLPTITRTTETPLTCVECFDAKFGFHINNENICISNNKSVDVLLLITSSPQNILVRYTIRKTWLIHTNHNKGNVRYVFLLGKSQGNVEIYQENERTKDIILADFQDEYSNLTFKTLMGFQWALQYCRTAKFVMKTDDDMYINIPALIIRIKENNDSLQTAVGGKCAVAETPIRDKRSKWYASYESYPQNSYPEVCSGTGYVTSMNVVSKVIQISRNIQFFHLEDVYVALCVRKLGYRCHSLKGFLYRPPPDDPCLYKNNNLVTVHKVPATKMQQIWNTKC